MTNTINTAQSAADQLAANIASAEALEAERVRVATEYHEAQARVTAGTHKPEDLEAVATNGAKAQALAESVRDMEARRPQLEQQIRRQEAEAWAQSLRDQMPEGTTARAEAIRQRAAEAIVDTIAQAREELEEVARFGAAAEATAYRYSRERTAPTGLSPMSSRDSSVLLDGINYGMVSASNVGEELGARVDREHAQAKAAELRAAR